MVDLIRLWSVTAIAVILTFFNSNIMGHYCYSSNLQKPTKSGITAHAVLFSMILNETRHLADLL
jgi:hypothetical protein